jgi:hypothetical protein
MAKNWRKKYSRNFFPFFDQKLQFTCVQEIGEAISPREHPALKK